MRFKLYQPRSVRLEKDEGSDAYLLFENSNERISRITRWYLRLHYVDPDAKCGGLMNARGKRHGYKGVIVCDVEGDWVV